MASTRHELALTLSTLIALGPLLLMACGKPDTLPQPRTDTGVTSQSPSQSQAGWEQKWNQTLSKAKEEGTVNAYVSAMWGPGLRSSIGKAFKDKYGIGVEFTPLQGSEFVVKVNAEQRAGLYIADVFGAGASTFLDVMKPYDLQGEFEPVLMLPEVLDPKPWGGDLFNYGSKSMFVMLKVVGRNILYNKDLLKGDEISSLRDLLKPQFKGRIAMIDPTLAGAGSAVPNHLVSVFGWEGTLSFLRELLTRQEPFVTADARLQTETVARGKYSILFGGSGQYKSDFMKAGAPLAVKIPVEGDYVTSSFGALAVPKRSPHPNAATVFINWLLTRDGQSLFARGAGGPSRRLDASTEGVDPIFIASPNEKLIWDEPTRTMEVVEAVKKMMAELR